MNIQTQANDLTELTIDEINRRFAAKTLTAEQLTRVHLARVAALNPYYNAIIFEHHGALEEARAIDARRDRGEKLGPLAGIPIVVKDTMDMAGYPSTGGWTLLCSKTGGVDLMPATDSPVVRRMREAGCVILGKTNVPILSATGTHANNSWAGPTLNAVEPTLMPGGSSAGTAAAVATQMAVVGLAEETGGSIQNPAAAQALVGIKPTFALVANTGVMPLAGSTRDVVGPIARTVRDAALVLDVLAGYDAADPKTVAAVGKRPRGGYTSLLDIHALRGKRLGLYGPGWRNRALSEQTQHHYARAQGELEDRGAILIADPFADSGFADLGHPAAGTDHFDARGMQCLPYDMQKYLERMGPDAAIKTWSEFIAVALKEDPFGPDGVLPFMHSLDGFATALADPTTNSTVAAFFELRESYLACFNGVMERYSLDALVFPQLRDELPARDSSDSLHETTVCEINIAGLPGVTVPAGYYASGCPFGLILVGRQWDEAGLLAMAYDYESATRHRRGYPHT
ncbi:amidase [Burkholderia sp. L27(2015)]|uniref:amidase n=1 Tax=Burkholderia sp. L27(2015) TaxID=1641858 RepID=UPI00131B216B|nr:amidase [Burkholderia sp. L27(2015)]